jgi:hypothetical protein
MDSGERKEAVADLLCPSCMTGVLELVTDGYVGEPGKPWRQLPFLACSSCEYCAEAPRIEIVYGGDWARWIERTENMTSRKS